MIFSDDPTYGLIQFQRRFRMKKDVFMRLTYGVRIYDDYFPLKEDCSGPIGFSSISKYIAALACIRHIVWLSHMR